MGGMSFVDLRDRYGITQLVFNENEDKELCDCANRLGREFCIQVTGTVNERQSKNANLATGDIEIIASQLNVLSESETPPFTIEENTDGGDDIRMKYRYLDLRRPNVRKNLELRHKMTILIRNFLDSKDFIEVETPILIGSTPEGARDFVVPSRMNPGQFYALPQSPQTLKQLLMVSGFDRYFQIAKCFRDEDLRADRQPEFTQIDCEMSFVDQDDVINLFEDMARHLFKELRGVELPAKLRQMPWHEAMKRYGSDKPDLRFGMEFVELADVLKGTGEFSVFNEAEYIGGICVPGCADYSRKQLNELTDFVKRPQVGAKGLVFVKYETDGSVKSSIDKFYSPEVFAQLKQAMGANDGDLVLIMSGDKANKTRVQLCSLRLEMGDRLGLRDKDKFECLWIVDFPLFEWSDEEQRLMATHHPFTMPNPDDIIWPGPYWFFGLMLQLYIVYRLFLYRKGWTWVVAFIAVCTIIELLCDPNGEPLNRWRYNFVGGMLPFGLGLLYAKYMRNVSLRIYGTTFIVSLLLIRFGSNHFFTWLFVPMFVCSAGVSFVKLLSYWNTHYPKYTFGIAKTFDWLGVISAALFISHPITRKIIIPISRGGDYWTGLLLYIIASVCVAWLFKEIMRRVPSPKL